MIASSSARHECRNIGSTANYGIKSSRTSREIHAASIHSKVSQDVKRGAFSISFLSRASNDLERKKTEDRRNSDESNDELSLGKLPEQSERLKESPAMKLCQEEWQPRFILITADDLLIAVPGTDDISDRVPLHEIEAVTRLQENLSDSLSGDSFENFGFNVHTSKNGYNCGREYCFSVESQVHLEDWLALVSKSAKVAKMKFAKRTLIETYRQRVLKLTNSNIWQRTSSFLVAANLVINIAQSQAMPVNGSNTFAIFTALDIIFTIIFTAELSLNLFAYWFWPFFSSGWHIFDFFVVTISLASLMLSDLPGISVLRLMRTFRVLRLFNKLRSLRTLINALAASLVPVFNAFIIMVLILVIYAILGVELFQNRNPEAFGTFAIASYTMFQISTFDGWTEVAKQLQSKGESGAVDTTTDPVVACFMCTFIVVVCWVLLPVVVAVLLDNFTRAVSMEKRKALEQDEQARMKEMGVSRADAGNPLDPLLEALSRYKSEEDFTRRINKLFKAMDPDMKGLVGFYALQEGLKKLTHLKPQIHLSSDDFQRITKNGELCNGKGQLDPRNFELMMREEVNKFLQSRIAQVYEDCTQNQDYETAATLGGLKLLTRRETSVDAASHDVIMSRVQAAVATSLAGIAEGLKGSVHEALCTSLHGIRQELCSELRGLRAELQSVKAGLHEARLQTRQSPVIAQPVGRDPFPSKHRRAILTLNPRRRSTALKPLHDGPQDLYDSNSIFAASMSSLSPVSSGLEFAARRPGVLPVRSGEAALDAPLIGRNMSRGVTCQSSPPIRWSALAKSASFAEMLQAGMKDSGMGFSCDAGLRFSRAAGQHRTANTSDLVLISICEDEVVDFSAIENRSTVGDDFNHIMGGNMGYFELPVSDAIDSIDDILENTNQPSNAALQLCDDGRTQTEDSMSDDLSFGTAYPATVSHDSTSESFDTAYPAPVAQESTSESSLHGIASNRQCVRCNGLYHKDCRWTNISSTTLNFDDSATSTLDRKEGQRCNRVSNGANGRVPRTCNVLCRLAGGGGNVSFFPDSSIYDEIHHKKSESDSTSTCARQ